MVPPLFSSIAERLVVVVAVLLAILAGAFPIKVGVIWKDNDWQDISRSIIAETQEQERALERLPRFGTLGRSFVADERQREIVVAGSESARGLFVKERPEYRRIIFDVVFLAFSAAGGIYARRGRRLD